MTQIIEEERFKVMTNIRKGVSGGVVASVACLVMSFFHGLSPEQNNAGLIITVGALESLRNILKKKLPGFFSWL